MEETSLIKARNKTIRDAYMRFVNSSSLNRGLLNRHIAISYLMEKPAERFYITPKMAERYVLGYLRGDKQVLCARKRAMIEDLVCVYRGIVNRRDGAKQADIWEELVESPAKSNYLTERRKREELFGYKGC